MRLDTSVSKLSQVSTERSKALLDLGILNLYDLIHFFPIDYIDLSNCSSISNTKMGFNYTISAVVYKIEKKQPKPGINLVEITLTDNTETLIATSFNQLWLADSLKENDKIAVSGTVEFNYGFKRMTNPYFHKLDDNSAIDDIAKIIPVYKHNDKISSTRILNIVKTAFEYVGNIDSFIPENLSTKYKLLDYHTALNNIHFPDSIDQLNKAKRTLKFIEVYAQQNIALCDKNFPSRNLINMLHFEFQENKIDKIVETASLYKEIGQQSFLLFHENAVLLQYSKILKKKFENYNVKFGFINEDTSKEIAWKYLYDFKNGDIDVLLTTNVCNFEEIKPNNLGIVIIDEKHKFLPETVSKVLSINNQADVLYTSCFPLTKNLAKLLYPDASNKWCPTKIMVNTKIDIVEKQWFMSAYEKAVKFAQDGNQVLILVPDVDFIIKRASEEIFNGWDVELIKKSTSKKESFRIFKSFEDGKIDVLVMSYYDNFIFKSKKPVYVIVEDANKIGLTNLHQLRNSVSQNGFENKMSLVCSFKGKNARIRLEQLIDIVDGDALISKDLSKTKPGANIGFKNWGFGFLMLINFVNDDAIIQTASKDAKENVKKENKLLNFYLSRFLKY